MLRFLSIENISGLPYPASKLVVMCIAIHMHAIYFLRVVIAITFALEREQRMLSYNTLLDYMFVAII